ncbi:UDP-N-acetylmuramoyl-tripeptide--D-alanyl-D-alanine ligase [Gracilibacillus dipsosauri]|uniref:UDP-N-acetylmuramoyl-tripeptide--D-alanyl-D-alanine ligase n=1 Tax=Gracilibacillus dipsosauri TaxID=178340 RepID=A0A317KXT2_9BACI|nr:UDP-N-acetylmuramoyl-tripeptide--D-alanyl-D-alanine ligase [Gracilibacillus dipsosauri]PWU67540.1 UDP-N-acetylmuramoyl-tripeptide--D-alanyl-D-alanine ligase [Gracilibacillus dipsosauri]
MITRTLEQVARMAEAELSHDKWKDVQIEGVSIDTRSIQQGQLFIPLPGSNVDGHKFVRQAFEKGARATFWKKGVDGAPEDIPLIFVDDPLIAMQQLARSYRDQTGVRIVGVTGSNGKTSTKDMIAEVLSSTFSVQKTKGNFNSQLGLPLSIFELEKDTEVMVLEMGMSDVGQIEILSKIAKPDIAVITNIGESHLEYLGSREKIADAKFEITTGLKNDGAFIYDGDEPLLQQKISSSTFSFQTISFGETDTSDLFPLSIELKDNGTEFTVNTIPQTPLFLPVLGMHNVKNALASIAVGQFMGINEEKMKRALAKVTLTSMRMEAHQGKNDCLIINDAYNASPTSMKAAVSLVDSLEKYHKKVLVLGDMLELGKAEKEFHQEVGSFISNLTIDYVFTYGRLGQFIASAVKEKSEEIKTRAFDDKQDLKESLLPLLDRDTVVLFKASRGMKLEEIVEDIIG